MAELIVHQFPGTNRYLVKRRDGLPIAMHRALFADGIPQLGNGVIGHRGRFVNRYVVEIEVEYAPKSLISYLDVHLL